MTEAMLASQLAVLEEPEDAMVVDGARPLTAVADEIRSGLGLTNAPRANRG
jgi:gluconate kinase